jgi:predicted secreted acid phosphatase
MVVTDLDKTIADNTERERRADSIAQRDTPRWYNEIQASRLIPLDVPVRYSREVLWHYKSEGCRVVYLSNRRKDTLEATRWWLDKHGYPKGDIILRPKDESHEEFKAKWLKSLKVRNDIMQAFDDEVEMMPVYRTLGVPVTIVEPCSEESWRKIYLNLIV